MIADRLLCKPKARRKIGVAQKIKTTCHRADGRFVRVLFQSKLLQHAILYSEIKAIVNCKAKKGPSCGAKKAATLINEFWRFEVELKYLERITQDIWQPISIHLNRSEIRLSLQIADFNLDGTQTSLSPKSNKSRSGWSE
jgi:hypothetical protein